MASVSAPIGAGFAGIALLTGAIWGKPMWGTWWIWDARLTSTLILLFIYFGYIGIRSAIPDLKLSAKCAAIFGMLGLVDLPVIHYSVNWWNTLHQGSSVIKFAKPDIETGMLYPLVFMLLAFILFYVFLLLTYARAELLWRERNTAWARKFIME
jgi:heme exporter protein C